MRQKEATYNPDLIQQIGRLSNQNELLIQLVKDMSAKMDRMDDCITQLTERESLPDPIYTLKEALPRLKMSPNTFRKKEKAGLILCKRDGQKIFVRHSEIERYLACLDNERKGK
ncbi:hypothetical protein [Parabacteroides sp. FAFU027]|uniref:hypothetical protein n=1 Tax=Parabacteroides sp. FAFU027 TaxID=2922715 RepID=UPI001FB03558|nr:hypothetical protein [Parabacteroides sp. FAFU027]